MFKLNVSAKELKAIIDTHKNVIDKKALRESLRYILVDASENGDCVTTSCNGNSAMVYRIKLDILEGYPEKFLLPVVKIPAFATFVVISIDVAFVEFDFLGKKLTRKTPLACEYPATKRWFPDEQSEETVMLSPKRLRDLLSGMSTDAPVEIEFKDYKSPVVFTQPQLGKKAILLPIVKKEIVK